MTEKKVILAKTEFDAMEAELQDLRAIVRSRTVVQILEESLKWHVVYNRASGTRIKYILGTDSDEEKMKVLADAIEYAYKKLAKVESDLRDSHLEIKELKAQTWYQKLFNK
jgi:isopropylmalate/homocitrate/citramalate synthase